MKQQAIELRRQGLTYKEISSTLNGAVSLDWCKKNLKGVKKEKQTDPLLNELISMASRPEGCTNYEAAGIVYKYNPDTKVTHDKVKGTKVKAKATDSSCLFRQGWEDVEDPLGSHRLMLSLVHDLYERIQETVNDYMEVYPNTSRQSVHNELVKLSNAFLSPEPLGRRLERNTETIGRLVDRKQGITALSTPPVNESAYTREDIDCLNQQREIITDEELDALCY